MRKDVKALEKGFSTIARKYDSLNRLLSLNMDRGWRKKAAAFLSLRQGSRVLDLCAGTGELAFAFAARQEVAQVAAVDFSEEMLSVAREKAKNEAFAKKLEFMRADALCLPYPDDSFDLVSMGFGLRNLTDYHKGMQEALRVLKQGGHIIIVEFSPVQASPFKNLSRFYISCLVPLIGGLFSGSPAAYKYLSASIRMFLNKEDVLGLMRGSGFSDCGAIPLSAGVVYLYAGLKG